MATQKGTGLVERAVREALGTLVSPQICEQLIARSLASHGLNNIPENGSELGVWLEGGLRNEVETVVGPDAAELLVSQLGPIAAYAAITVPRTTQAGQNSLRAAAAPAPPRCDLLAEDPFADSGDDGLFEEPDRPTNLRFDTGQEPDWEPQRMPVPAAFESGPPTGLYANKELSYSPIPDNANGQTKSPALHTTRPQDNLFASKGVPCVLTATANAHDLEALRRYLSGSANVMHIPDLVGLLDALEDGSMVEPIVLIDCQRPTVHVTSVAAIGEDLPKGTTVVLWGADDGTWNQIDKDRTPLCRWVRCSREATTDDVGSLCSMLLG
jgi:hypothetical protein